MSTSIDIDAMNVSIKVIKDTAFDEEDFLTKCKRVMSALENVEDYIGALSDTILKWDDQIESEGLNYADFPPSVVDYIDELIAADKIKSAQDIIALFETGELKGIVADDNKT